MYFYYFLLSSLHLKVLDVGKEFVLASNFSSHRACASSYTGVLACGPPCHGNSCVGLFENGVMWNVLTSGVVVFCVKSSPAYSIPMQWCCGCGSTALVSLPSFCTESPIKSSTQRTLQGVSPWTTELVNSGFVTLVLNSGKVWWILILQIEDCVARRLYSSCIFASATPNPYTAQGFGAKNGKGKSERKESRKIRKQKETKEGRTKKRRGEQKRKEDLKADSHDLKLESPFENELASKVPVRLLKYITS